MPDAIDTIVSTHLAHRHDGEDFVATWRRIGAAPFKEALMALLDLANGELLASGAEPSVVLEPTADAAALPRLRRKAG